MVSRTGNRYAPPLKAQTDSRVVLRFGVVSFLGHIVLFAVVLFSGAFLPEKRYTPSVIDVRMVSLAPQTVAGSGETAAPVPAPPPPPEATAPAPQKVQPEPPPPAAVEMEAPKPAPPKPPEAVQEAPVSIAPKPKQYREKTSLKQKTFTSKPVVNPTENRPAKESPTRSEQVKEAIEKLKKRLQTPPPGSPARGAAVGAGAGSGQGGGGAGWPGSGAAGDLIDVYKAEIASRIQKNWAFSEQLTGGMKDLSAVIVMKIMPDGEIGDVWFEKHSGNSLLDDSAFRAVQKSNPLPPLPKGYFRSFYLVGLIFTPEGIQ